MRDDFEAKNKQLLDEMPRFYSSRLDYFQPSFESLIRAQVRPLAARRMAQHFSPREAVTGFGGHLMPAPPCSPHQKRGSATLCPQPRPRGRNAGRPGCGLEFLFLFLRCSG